MPSARSAAAPAAADRATASPAATRSAASAPSWPRSRAVACDDVGDRDVDLLDRGRLLLGRQLDLARGVLGGRATSAAICLNDAATSANCRGPASTALEPVSVAITVVLTAPRTSSISARISLVEPATRSASLRISSATTAKRLPALAGARRLDGGVDRQDVGLLGQLGDDVEHAADLLRLLAQVEHVADDQVDLACGCRRSTSLVRVDGGVAGARRVVGLARRSARRAARSRRSGARSRAAR